MRKTFVYAVCCLVVAALAAPLAAAELAPVTSFTAENFRVHAGQGEALTLPSEAAPADVVTNYLAPRHASATFETLVVDREYHLDVTGMTHVEMTQEIDGLEVFGTSVKAAVDEDGQLVHLMENLVTPPSDGILPASIGPSDALSAALRELHPWQAKAIQVAHTSGNTTVFNASKFYWRNPLATKVAIPLRDGTLVEGYLVETWTDRDNLLHHTLIGDDGEVLGVQLRTAVDSYNIFPDHPDNSSQTIVNGPGSGNTESPIGWLFSGDQLSINIAGNNVNAYLDRDTNDAPDPGGNTISDGNFVSVADLTQDPTLFVNQEVAVQNLFYLNNVIHDKLYRHGFVEGVGNFQEDNFGNGGLGSDSVDAEAQDGSGLNNANFATPDDGSNPRMQMFIWDQTNPRRDGDVDSDIPWHEYGHGLTWRMIDNMSGPMSGAIGEGQSDVLSIYINDNDVVGEYSSGDPVGIRSEPYTGYSRTYGDFSGDSVHFDGEIYAAIMWDLKTRYANNGLTLDTLFDDMVGGMNFTATGPAFEDMRDGILQQTASSRDCFVWESFAKFGVGVNAEGSVTGGGPFGGGNVSVTEDFTLPAECSECTVTEDPETSCLDGADNDCDGLIDADDSDCDTGGDTCTAGQKGDACTSDADCCSNKCRGPSGRMTCK